MTQIESPEAIAGRLLKLFEPAPELKLSEWADEHIELPEGQSVRPGKYKTWPYLREIFDVMGDTRHTNVTILKSARIGYTAGLMTMIGARAVMNPGPIILLMPTDEDARGIAVDQLEPLFEATPALRGLIRRGRSDGRSTITRKAIPGGSVKILSARAPRKLRRHDCRDLLIDEADGMEITAEGDPIAIAIGRTLAQPGRKIIAGSTPTEEGVSVITRRYEESDQRIFMVPCPLPNCGAFNEIQWSDIICEDPGNPASAAYFCPHCRRFVPERHKPWMIENGTYRAQKPEVEDHAGFRINALVSLLPNATWPRLMKDWFTAKRGGPAEMQPFVNTVLGRAWRTSVNAADADTLAERAEAFGLDGLGIPREVLLITAGVDTQDDRLEMVILGWPRFGAPFVLGVKLFEGNTLDDAVWSDMDRWLLKAAWKSPRGWWLKVDAVAIDSGGREGRTQKVYDYCQPRVARKIFAIKGVEGPKRIWEKAKKVKGNMRLHNIAVDVVKTEVLDALGRDPFPDGAEERDNNAVRFSEDLPDSYYSQVTNEVRRIKYKNNRPKYVFELKRQGARNEALDCTVYAWAVRQSPAVKTIDLLARERREPDPDEAAPVKKKSAADWAAAFNPGR